MSVPAELKYTREHEWLRVDGEEAVVGITDHAQQLLGDVVFVQMPTVGETFEAGAECAVVESVKAASSVYMPVSADVLAINEQLSANFELINTDPYGEGWLFRIKIRDMNEINGLLDADAYQQLITEE